MIRRLLSVIVVALMSGVALRSIEPHVVFNAFETYWREIFFAIIAGVAAWLFAVTLTLRPVVAIFAALAFFVVAKMDDPSPASFLAALDRFGARLLDGVSLG